MSVLDRIKSIEYDKNDNNLFGIKSAVLWGHSKETNSIFPLLYISKPKAISEEDYKEILDKLLIDLKK